MINLRERRNRIKYYDILGSVVVISVDFFPMRFKIMRVHNFNSAIDSSVN